MILLDYRKRWHPNSFMIAHIDLIYFPRHVAKHFRFCLRLSVAIIKKDVLSEKSTEKLLAEKLGRQNWS